MLISDNGGHLIHRVPEGLALSPEEVLVGLLEGPCHDQVVVHRKSEVERAQGQGAHPGEVHDREMLFSESRFE